MTTEARCIFAFSFTNLLSETVTHYIDLSKVQAIKRESEKATDAHSRVRVTFINRATPLELFGTRATVDELIGEWVSVRNRLHNGTLR